jgi:rare lipoprotein A
MQRSMNRLALLLALLAGCTAGACLADTASPEAAVPVPQEMLQPAAATPADSLAPAGAAVSTATARPSLAARLLQRGRASWYAHRLHGRRTASGERYDRHALTAAHPTLPISSYARVRNPANGREVVVRINDRGPFGRGRVIDVSHAAAALLGILHGSRDVEIEPLTDGARRGGARHQGATATPPAPHLSLSAPSDSAS